MTYPLLYKLNIWVLQAKKILAKKKAAAAAKKSSSSSTAASLAAKEAKERAAKKNKVKDKKNYNQVRSNLRLGSTVMCNQITAA